MSIAAVVTRGFGSFGSVGDVVLRGYSIGEAVASPTRPARGGGWMPNAEELDDLRDRARRSDRARRKSRRERREAERRLDAALRAAWRRAMGFAPDLAGEIFGEGDPLARPEMRRPEAVLALVARIEERIAEEDDIEVLVAS